MYSSVAYNGYMNEEFLNQYENVYVPPVGDEAVIGVYQHADCTINNNIHKSNTFAALRV